MCAPVPQHPDHMQEEQLTRYVGRDSSLQSLAKFLQQSGSTAAFQAMGIGYSRGSALSNVRPSRPSHGQRTGKNIVVLFADPFFFLPGPISIGLILDLYHGYRDSLPSSGCLDRQRHDGHICPRRHPERVGEVPRFELAGLNEQLNYGIPIFHNYGFGVPLLFVAISLVAANRPGKFSIAHLFGSNDDKSLFDKFKQ